MWPEYLRDHTLQPSWPIYPSLSTLSFTMEEEAVDKLGFFHIHQFGEGHLRVLIFQVCMRCPSSWKEVDASWLSQREHNWHGWGTLRLIQAKHRRLNDFGGNIMQSLSSGGATGLTRYYCGCQSIRVESWCWVNNWFGTFLAFNKVMVIRETMSTVVICLYYSGVKVDPIVEMFNKILFILLVAN